MNLRSRYYVSVTKTCSWVEIGVSLCKLLQMVFYNTIFQRKLILKHQNFSLISGNFWSLCESYAVLVFDLPNEEQWRTLKDRVNHLDMKLPTYLVIHTGTLTFFYHLIQKLPRVLILDSHFYPRIEDLSTCTKRISNNLSLFVCFCFFPSQIPVINKLLLVLGFQHYFQSVLRQKILLLISLSIPVQGLSWKKLCCPLMNYDFLFLIVQFPIPSLYYFE